MTFCLPAPATRRRAVHACLAATLAVCGVLAAPLSAAAQERIGILMLHGKNPGSAQDPHFSPIKARLEAEGWLVQLPDMPWSRTRYLEGTWDAAMQEMTVYVQALRSQGATRIVLVGHSMGAPAALSFAARGGDAQALVLLAPGHVPKGYYNNPNFKPVRESIDEARALVTAGKGDSRERFADINQGRQQPVITTAANYLSYFDPASDAEMSVTAPRVPAATPVLTVVGEKDPMHGRARGYFADLLPANPRSSYLEVGGGHIETPRVAYDAMVAWIKTAVAPAGN